MSVEPVSAYLSLGSNLGNRQWNLDKAIELLGQRVKIDKVSPVYETEPVGNTDQPRFLNLALEVSTRLEPAGLLMLAKGIELKMGRARNSSNQPRPIDIDILTFGDRTVDTPDLVIPHPRMAERAFVLVPLAEIAPDLKHPQSGKTVHEMLAAVTETQGVLKWEGD